MQVGLTRHKNNAWPYRLVIRQARRRWRPGACDVVRMTPVGNATGVVVELSRPGAHGETYCLTVEATNGAGLSTRVSSDCVLIDATPPLVPRVIIGNDFDELVGKIGRSLV